jgi:hypothetical protein
MKIQTRSTISVACLAAILAIGLTAVGQPTAGKEATPAERGSDYDLAKAAKGKILYLLLKHRDEATGDNYTVFLTDVHTAHIDGRTIVVGTGYAAEKDDDAWYKDMTVGVAWNTVMAFHVMTEKQYEKFIAAPDEDKESQAAVQKLVK